MWFIKRYFSCFLLTIFISFFTLLHSMNSVKIVTNDGKEFAVSEKIITCSDIIFTIVNSVDDREEDPIILSEISSEVFKQLLPFLKTIAHNKDSSRLTTELEQKFLAASRIKGNNLHLSKLLNAAVYLDCSILIDFFIQMLSRIILKKYNVNCVDDLLESLHSIKLSKELSYLLGKNILKDFLSHEFLNSLVTLPSGIKNSLQGKDITCLNFSPKKDKLACAIGIEGISLYDIQRDKIVSTLARFKETINDICFSWDGSKIAAVSKTKGCETIIRIYNSDTGKYFKRFVLNKDNAISLLSFQPSSDILIANDHNYVWNSLNNKLTRAPVSQTGPFRYSADGTLVSEPFHEGKKLLKNWLITNKELLNELLQLKVEYIITFMFIVQKLSQNRFADIEQCPKAKVIYKVLKQSPIISKCIKNFLQTHSNSRCVVS